MAPAPLFIVHLTSKGSHVAGIYSRCAWTTIN